MELPRLFLMVVVTLLGVCIHANYNVNAAKDFQTCKVSIDDETAKYMRRKLRHVEIANRLMLNIPPGFNYSVTNETVFPKNWVLTYTSRKHHRTSLYIDWPVSYIHLALGLFDSRVLSEEILINLTLSPPSCSLIFGEKNTTLAIAGALKEITDKYFRFDKNDDENYYWCYLSEKQGVKETLIYKVSIAVSIDIQVVGFKCCRYFYEKYKSKRQLNCLEEVLPFSKYLVIIPIIIGMFGVCYFPILLMKAASYIYEIGKNTKKANSDHEEYIRIGDSGDVEADNDVVYTLDDHPVCFSVFIFGFCGLAERNPVVASRIRRIFFIFLSPLFMYIRLIVFYITLNDVTIEFVKRGVPVGFMSLLAGFSESRKNFLPFLGGPYIFLASYFVSGIIVLLFPSDESNLFERGLTDHGQFVTLLNLDLETVEGISFHNCRKFKGYMKVYSALKSYFWLILNPEFWRFAFRFQSERWKTISSKLNFATSCKKILLLPKLLICIVYIPVCAAEIILALCLYGFPIILFIVISTKGYFRFSKKTLRNKNKVLGIFLSSCFSVLVLYFAVSYLFISVKCFMHLSRFIVSVYLAVVIYSNTSFELLSFVAIFFIYAFKIISGFGKGYHHLLQDVIQILIEKEKDESRKNNSIVSRDLQNLMRENSENAENGFFESSELKDLFHRQDKYLHHLIPCSNPRYSATLDVSERPSFNVIITGNEPCDRMPGISKSLYMYIVERHRPIYLHCFASVFSIALIFTLFYGSYRIIIMYNQTEEISRLMEILSVLAVCSFPKLLQCLFLKSKRKLAKHKQELRRSIDEYGMTLDSVSETVT